MYYILSTPGNIFPVLTNSTPQTTIHFDNISISAHQILNIVKDQNTEIFPFTVNIYTSYFFTKCKSNHIRDNMIGQYLNPNSAAKVLYVLLTPHLYMSNFVMINTLPVIRNDQEFTRHNLFVNTTIPEGQNILKQTSSKEVTLNQHFCICDHKETQSYVASRDRPHLGKLLLSLHF